MFDTLRHYILWSVGLAGATTQTSAAEQAAIARYASGRRRCVEIGVWHGVNTRRIREAMHPEGVLTGVDPFFAGRLGLSFEMRIARHEIGRSSNAAFQLLRCTSQEALTGWREPIDFIFIDGDHSYDGLKTDWEGWSAHLSPGGVACLHDSHSSATRPIDDAGSVRYTNEVILRDARFEVLEVVETLTVLRRR